MRHFSVEFESIGGNVIIKLAGELDANTCVIANQKFEEALSVSKKRVLIDCTDLLYVSSAGLGVFIATYQACNQQEVPLILYSVRPKVLNVFEILGLEKLLNIKTSLEEALAVR